MSKVNKNNETREVTYYSVYSLDGVVQVPIDATNEEINKAIHNKVIEDSEVLEYYGAQLEDWFYE